MTYELTNGITRHQFIDLAVTFSRWAWLVHHSITANVDQSMERLLVDNEVWIKYRIDSEYKMNEYISINVVTFIEIYSLILYSLSICFYKCILL